MNLAPRPCTRAELGSAKLRDAAAILGEPFQFHRKLWEYVVLFHEFRELGLFRPLCLGFGVGKEPLPLAFARFGGSVLASDQAPEKAWSWIETGQHWGARGAEVYAGRGLSFRHVDMREIPADLEGRFDFLWSSCALEHIGGIMAGEKFVLDAMRCLKRGGFAFHTTEFNVSSDRDTLDVDELCLFRRCDVERMVSRLRDDGHEVENPAWELLEAVDPPAPENRPHLTLQLGDFATTSFFLAARRGL